MARIKLVYLGGGSTRAAGTMASFMANGADFDGSEVVLVDLDPDRLELIRTLAEKMARARGLDIAVTATTDRRAALDGCDAVLSSFRPGGFAGARPRRAHPARARRDRPGDAGRRRLLHGAARDHRARRTSARRWSRSARTPGSSTTRTRSTSSPRRSPTTRPIKIVSLCEGPIYFRDTIAESAGLDPALLRRDDGGAQPRLLGGRAELRRAGSDAAARRGLGAAPGRPDARRRSTGGSSSSRSRWGRSRPTTSSTTTSRDEVLAEYRAKPTTRAEDILGWSTDYWRHYEEQAPPTTRSSIRAAHVAASTSSSSRST